MGEETRRGGGCGFSGKRSRKFKAAKLKKKQKKDVKERIIKER